jgi:hypothetical protein
MRAKPGQTIIEKFEAHSDVGFSVVLLTPDNVGGLKDGPQRPRPRQNVILALPAYPDYRSRGHDAGIARSSILAPYPTLRALKPASASKKKPRAGRGNHPIQGIVTVHRRPGMAYSG